MLFRSEETLEYAKNLPVTYLQYSVFTPYPGTPIYESYNHLIKASKYEDFTQWDLVFEHSSLTPEQVRKALDKAYKESYLSPRRVLKIATRLLKIQLQSLT